MELITINELTKLPEPTAALLLIPDFLKLWTRRHKIDGDRDGSRKTRNLQELGYIYYHARYDSRFKLLDENGKEAKIRELLKITPDWKPDELVLACLIIYRDSQVTSSSALVEAADGTNVDLALWIKAKRIAIRQGTASPKDVSDILDIVASLPKLILDTKLAHDTLNREQEKNQKGRGGRVLGKFEVPVTKGRGV